MEAFSGSLLKSISLGEGWGHNRRSNFCIGKRQEKVIKKSNVFTMQPDIVRVFRLQRKPIYYSIVSFSIFFLFLCRRFLRNCSTDFLQTSGMMHYHLNSVPMFNFLKIHFRSFLTSVLLVWMTFLSEYRLKNDSN